MAILGEQLPHLIICSHSWQPMNTYLKLPLCEFSHNTPKDDTPCIFYFKKPSAAHVLSMNFLLQEDLEFQASWETPHRFEIMMATTQ